MTQTRTFPVGEVLSALTGKLVSDMDGVYKVLDHVEGVDHMTHELPEAMRRLAPEIIRQVPALAEVQAPELKRDTQEETEEACRAWVASVVDYIGTDTITLATMPQPDGGIEPYNEGLDLFIAKYK